MKKVWTRKMNRTLKQEYPTADLRLLASTLGVTLDALRSHAQKMHLRRTVNVKHVWTPEDDAILRDRYADTDTHEIAALLGTTYSATSQRALALGIYKSSEYKARVWGQLDNGRGTRFQNGNVPFNKGKKDYQFRSRDGRAKCALTQFKPGQVPHNARPVGFECVHADGYVYVKVAEHQRMMPKHIHVWQQANGPVPSGMMVTFRDGNRLNCTIDNLQLMTRAEAVRLLAKRLSPERKREIIEKRTEARNKTIRMDKIRLHWGLEPKTKLVKRW